MVAAGRFGNRQSSSTFSVSFAPKEACPPTCGGSVGTAGRKLRHPQCCQRTTFRRRARAFLSLARLPTLTCGRRGSRPTYAACLWSVELKWEEITIRGKKNPKMDLAGLECVCKVTNLCLLLQVSVITVISAIYCGFLGLFFFKRKKQIALQQDPFRSLFDSMTLLD